MLSAVFSVRGNRVLLCMEICEKLRYNFDAESEQQIESFGDKNDSENDNS